jgi:broad-specificity NMP kinase
VALEPVHKHLALATRKKCVLESRCKMAEHRKRKPTKCLRNLLLTGTPGTGKSTVAAKFCARMRLNVPANDWPVHINVSELIKENPSRFAEEFDSERDCFVINEDAVVEHLEPIVQKCNVVLEHHSSDWFPERWFSRVVVLASATDVLYRRLEARGYTTEKVQENVEAEIMQVCADEAMTSYDRKIVDIYENNTEDDMERIVGNLCEWWLIRS